MKKLYFGLISFLLINLTINAQQVRFGVKAGVTLADAAIKETGLTDYDGTRLRVAPNIGGYVEIKLLDFLYVQPNLMFIGKGYKKHSGEDIEKFTPSYLEMPIYLMLKLPLGDVNVFGGVGPYVAYGLTGKWSRTFIRINDSLGNVPFDGNSYKIWGDPDVDDYLKRFDAGASLTLGVQLNNFSLSAQYDYGMVNVGNFKFDEFKTNNIWHNRTLSFSVGYQFGRESRVKDIGVTRKKNNYKRRR